jgi:hypothetical protein
LDAISIVRGDDDDDDEGGPNPDIISLGIERGFHVI